MGYLVVNRQGKVLLVHRLAMEEYLGRPLRKGEVVHHINGNKTDNRIENLVVCQTQAAHVHEHHPERHKTRGKCRHCDKPEWASGLCPTHHSRQRRGIPSERPIRPYKRGI